MKCISEILREKVNDKKYILLMCAHKPHKRSIDYEWQHVGDDQRGLTRPSNEEKLSSTLVADFAENSQGLCVAESARDTRKCIAVEHSGPDHGTPLVIQDTNIIKPQKYALPMVSRAPGTNFFLYFSG